jgi:hypothetical protein
VGGQFGAARAHIRFRVRSGLGRAGGIYRQGWADWVMPFVSHATNGPCRPPCHDGPLCSCAGPGHLTG